MSNYRKIIIIIALILLSTIIEASPARAFALAARGNKNPRTIRAPYRNEEISIARGFGKRDTGARFKLLNSGVGTGIRSNSMNNNINNNNNIGPDTTTTSMNRINPLNSNSNLNNLNNNNNNNNDVSLSDSYFNHERKFYDEPIRELSGKNDDLFDGRYSESVPIEWMINELTANPNLMKTILQRFVDINRDGLLSTRELMATPFDSTEIY